MTSGKPRDVEVTFEIQGLGQTLHVLNFQAEEAISKLFSLDVTLACSSSSLSFESAVGQPACLTLQNDQGSHYLHGMVNRFMQLEKARNFTVYMATVVPKAWKMLHRADCRIFQKKTAKQIVETVLQKHGVDHSFKLKSTPVEREYCVQYRESDWNFVARLLEEEGFFFSFKHEAGKHTMEIGDDPLAHAKVPGNATIPYHPPSGQAPGEEHVISFSYEESVRSGKVTLNEYNFEKPTLDQKSLDAASKDTDLELYDYPGIYTLPPFGKSLATVRLKEQQAFRKMGSGASDSIRLRTGSTFTLESHDRKDLNQEYLLTRIHHSGEKHEDLEGGSVSKRIRYHNSFTVIPKSVPYKPPRVTPKPFVQGAQTAFVVGPSGEEIYTDKHGRVKVQFHWDRLGTKDQNSSCWIRVSQLWAGQSWGAMWIPRIGHEVIVDFLEGDPDRPIITGRVYHAQNVPPYTLPDEKTKSTIKSNSTLGGGGFNELRFEDKKGSEEIYIHAQKDQNQKILNNHSISIGNDQTRHIEHNRTSTINEGDDKFTLKKGNQSVTLENGNQTVKVTGDISIEATSSITLKVGGSTIKMDKGKIAINAPLVKINC